MFNSILHFVLFVYLFGASYLCSAFPIEQFKDFPSKKAAIENFDFRVKSSRFTISGLDTNAYRNFDFKMESPSIYLLTENQDEYVLSLSNPTNRSKTIAYNLHYKMCWGRYENHFWNTFKSNSVVTTLESEPNQLPSVGPAKSSSLIVNVAYDALNFGIVELEAHKLIWTNLDFYCPSNRTGYKVTGKLNLDENGIPLFVLYSLSKGSVSYRYRASYYFTNTDSLPIFFPSRIKIELMEFSPPKVISQYQIDRLNLSDPALSLQDVSLNYYNSNVQKYIYTNNETYHLTTNGMMIQVSSNLKNRESGSRRNVIAFFVLAFCLATAPIVFLTRLLVEYKQKKINKTNKNHET